MTDSRIREYAFTGNLTLSSIHEVKELMETIANDNPTIAVISMEHVGRVDSSGLGAIFRFQGELKRKSIKFAFTNVASQPRHLFNFSMLDSLVQIFTTNEEAVQNLQKNN